MHYGFVEKHKYNMILYSSLHGYLRKMFTGMNINTTNIYKNGKSRRYLLWGLIVVNIKYFL